MSRFQGNNLISDKGKDDISSFQIAKKNLWKTKCGALNGKWNKTFHRDVKLSSCNDFTEYLTDPNIIRCTKILNFLRKTIANFRWTYVPAEWKTIYYTKAELTKAEGRSNRIRENVKQKPIRRILQYNQYLAKKETRLFSTIKKNDIHQTLFLDIYDKKNVYESNTSGNLTKKEKILNLYKIAIQKKNLIMAFKSLKEKPIPGLDGQTKVRFSERMEKSIIKLQKELRKHKYKPSPMKTIFIPKFNGGKRLLSVSSVQDKIVQISIKNELEKIYEPIFRESSYGFRPKLSCHSALKQIKKKWQPVKWFISLDIVKCFDKIQHEILITILKKKLHDQELIDLLRKFLNVGYIDVHNLTNRGRYETEKITQMTIISPIMCNILFHELDEFMEDKLIPKFTNNRFSEENKKKFLELYYFSHNQDNLQIHELSQLKKIIPLLKRNEEILKKNSFYYKKDDLYQEQQLFYLRYADAILLGYLGTKNECKKVIVEINKYLQKNLKLELNLSLCFVNSVWNDYTYFLGFELNSNQRPILNKNLKNEYLNKHRTSNIFLLIPIKKILNCLLKKGYLRKITKTKRYKGKGVGKLSWTSNEKIVRHFSSIIKNYVNYYICANKRSQLWSIVHVLKDSCYLTLAWKHKLKTKKQVKEKFGADLKIYENGRLVTELFYPQSLKTELKFLDRSYSGYVTNLELEITDKQKKAQMCFLCHSTTNLELHRTNLLKKNCIERSKKSFITLCTNCRILSPAKNDEITELLKNIHLEK